MNLAVAGWHFHLPFVESMQKAAARYDVCWVCHRLPPAGVVLSCCIDRNVGLEFGCYDWFLKNRWKGGDTLFLHDDTEVTPEALDQVAQIKHDQVFLFPTQEDAAANGKAHGRAFFCSERLLTRLKADGGFWYNEAPETSLVIPATTADAPNYHNTGIQTFVAYLKSLRPEFNVRNVGILPGLKTGYRGRI